MLRFPPLGGGSRSESHPCPKACVASATSFRSCQLFFFSRLTTFFFFSAGVCPKQLTRSQDLVLSNHSACHLTPPPPTRMTQTYRWSVSFGQKLSQSQSQKYFETEEMRTIAHQSLRYLQSLLPPSCCLSPLEHAISCTCTPPEVKDDLKGVPVPPAESDTEHFKPWGRGSCRFGRLLGSLFLAPPHL